MLLRVVLADGSGSLAAVSGHSLTSSSSSAMAASGAGKHVELTSEIESINQIKEQLLDKAHRANLSPTTE